MIFLILILSALLSGGTLWVGYRQFRRSQWVLGAIVVLIGGVVSLAQTSFWTLAGLSWFFKTSGEPFDWGPLGSLLMMNLLVIFYGCIACVLSLAVVMVWAWAERIGRS